jgi:hypothetical protein
MLLLLRWQCVSLLPLRLLASLLCVFLLCCLEQQVKAVCRVLPLQHCP